MHNFPKYDETLEYLYARLPMYQRIGAAAYKNDLNNTLALCAALGNPEKKFRSIHIAGTNGKGSTSHALASVFQEHGYTTGLYTSPHLTDFRERIKVNGEMIGKEAVVAFVERCRQWIETIQPSFFETTVAMAFDYFAQYPVDIAIIETGLGGRLDSTNVIVPELSIITNISFDHTDLLGDTLEQIAFEKAGIIKPGIPVVIGESNEETDKVFLERAKACESEIVFADRNPDYYNTELETDLEGDFQQKNMVTVLQSTDVLRTKGFPLNKFTIARALQNIKSNTGLRGRWEVIQHKPFVVLDTGHNEAGLKVAMQALSNVPAHKKYLVFGVVKEKDTTRMWQHLPVSAYYFFCKPSIPRGRDDQDLLEEALKHHIKGEACGTVKQAYNRAIQNANPEDVIFIGGSTFVVADFLQDLK